MLELLLNAGSNIDAQNIVGDAPLHKAALNGRALSADYLIRAGANVNIRNEFAQTPLHTACVSGNIEVVQRLVQGGADTSAQDAAEVMMGLGRGLGLGFREEATRGRGGFEGFHCSFGGCVDDAHTIYDTEYIILKYMQGLLRVMSVDSLADAASFKSFWSR